jgi:hypothetical protein
LPPGVTERGGDPVVLGLGHVEWCERDVEFCGELRGKGWRSFGATATDDDRRMWRLRGFGQRRGFGDGVMLALVVEGVPGGCRPQPGDDVQLFGEPVEALAQRRERDRVGLMFGFEPAGADTQFDTAAAHFVDLGDRDRQRPRVAEGR